jgi:hypothetical protein
MADIQLLPQYQAGLAGDHTREQKLIITPEEAVRENALYIEQKVQEQSGLVDAEGQKIRVKENVPVKYTSTTEVPPGTGFKMEKSGTRYIKMEDGSLRRVNPDGTLVDRSGTKAERKRKSTENKIKNRTVNRRKR